MGFLLVSADMNQAQAEGGDYEWAFYGAIHGGRRGVMFDPFGVVREVEMTLKPTT